MTDSANDLQNDLRRVIVQTTRSCLLLPEQIDHLESESKRGGRLKNKSDKIIVQVRKKLAEIVVKTIYFDIFVRYRNSVIDLKSNSLTSFRRTHVKINNKINHD